jgi:hypothetical protein
MPLVPFGDNYSGGYYSPLTVSASNMRCRFALIFCFVCLSGCVGVREHWADGFDWLWHRTSSQVKKHGPEVAGAVAVGAAEGAADQAINGHETPRQWNERVNSEFFDK